MNLRTFLTFTGLAVTLTLISTLPAAAAVPTFGVQANVSTWGIPDPPRDNSGPVVGGFEAFASAGPAQATMGTLPSNTVHGQVEGNTYATFGFVSGHAATAADHLAATNFSNSRPQVHTEGQYWDVLTVESGSLPAGTPVTLVFRNTIDVIWSGSGLHDGYVQPLIQIGSVSASNRYGITYRNDPPEFRSQTLTVNTRIGARLSVDSKLRILSQSFYFAPGPSFDATQSIDASATLSLESASAPDVWVRPDSGLR